MIMRLMKEITCFSGLVIFLTGVSVSALIGQEIQATVNINTPQLQLSDPKVFQTLQNDMQEFLNNQKWTDDYFEQEERIKMQVNMTITKELSPTAFEAEIMIQASRPVFNSAYETIMLSHNDRQITFSYQQFTPFIFNQNTFTNNLTSILSFYVYIILGMDYDSFSLYGGEQFFNNAQDILNLVPQSVAANNKGWRSIDGNRNRYWIIENFLNPRIKPYRKLLYDYHRQGLDLMFQDPAAARSTLLGALETLQQVNRNYPNAMVLQMFSLAKANEIVEIFKEGTSEEKNRLKSVMTQVDAANSSKYQEVGK